MIQLKHLTLMGTVFVDFFSQFEKNMPLWTMALKINLNFQIKNCCLMIKCHVWVAVVHDDQDKKTNSL